MKNIFSLVNQQVELAFIQSINQLLTKLAFSESLVVGLKKLMNKNIKNINTKTEFKMFFVIV